MADQDRVDVRSELLDALLQKVGSDPYPSADMLDAIESLLTPDEVSEYAEGLLARVRADKYPSWPLIRRLQRLA